jgi:hypothetical protein
VVEDSFWVIMDTSLSVPSSLAQSVLTSGKEVSLHRSPDDTQITYRNVQLLRVLGSTIRLKAEVDSSSRHQEDFICREEKGCIGHAVRPGNPWSHGSGWKLGFITFFIDPGWRCLSLVNRCFLGRRSVSLANYHIFG